ncbi:hypothetical protein [Streptomyces bacillaris]|uniref:hypothetical protein n=1 Tax=Streptomyces bacillaris TaxID=68179 RepID=UPI00362737EE
MTNHASCQVSAALALTQLLVDHPAVAGRVTWTVDPLGALHGEQPAETDQGQAIDSLARLLGCTSARTVLDRRGDRHVLVQLATVWQGVPVEAWTTYTELPVTVGGPGE